MLFDLVSDKVFVHLRICHPFAGRVVCMMAFLGISRTFIHGAVAEFAKHSVI